jgi:hypothetical protein
VNRVTLVSLLVIALSGAPCGLLRAEEAPAAAPATAAETRVASATKADNAIDRMDLDATSITGNRELPKVMSIVPWKAAEPPAGPDRPMGSLIEDVLSPVDRDEFRREITYYRDLTSQSTGDGAATGVPVEAVEHVRPESKPSSPPGASIP